MLPFFLFIFFCLLFIYFYFFFFGFYYYFFFLTGKYGVSANVPGATGAAGVDFRNGRRGKGVEDYG